MDSYSSFIHSYWFRDNLDFDRWFKTSHQYDSEIKILFSDILNQAEKGNLENWSNTQQGFVSYVVLLDQFSRQIYRNSHKAYSNDVRVINFVRQHEQRAPPAAPISPSRSRRISAARSRTRRVRLAA